MKQAVYEFVTVGAKGRGGGSPKRVLDVEFMSPPPRVAMENKFIS